MKQILSLLVAFVFVQTQCWALSGGPNYAGDSNDATGEFAGVLVPTGLGTNALGLFSLTSPVKGLATGTFVVFASGSTFNGTIKGLIDPDKLTLQAIAEGKETATFVTVDPDTGAVTTEERTVALAAGQITALLSKTVDRNGRISATSGTRLTGTGSLATSDLNFGRQAVNAAGGSRTTPTGTLTFTVDGFKQADLDRFLATLP